MYGSFAQGYHELMEYSGYRYLADFYEKLFMTHSLTPSLILDLGCGTGSLTALMASRGYDMIGIDISEEMLAIAHRENSAKNILYLKQDMREFELYGTVDVIYSSFDCLNYITSMKDLRKTFRLCANYLNTGGLFIFDVNTPHYFSNVLDGKAYAFEHKNTYLVWQSALDKRKRICDFYLDMFYKKGDYYERYFEKQQERVYCTEDLKKIGAECGFEVLGVYSSTDFHGLENNSERAYFVMKNKTEHRTS